MRLIECDTFPFEFLSQLAERESWRKEIHRPIYHVHKWWAKRLGSVFRGILLGCSLPPDASLSDEFYRVQALENLSVLDPFMGSGTTVGEAHKMGFTAFGRDINPVAVEAVTTALGPMDRRKILSAFDELSAGVGGRIRDLYRSTDARGRPCDVLYFFWVMQATCPACGRGNDLFPSYVVARNAYPARKPEIQVLCPVCGEIFANASIAHTARCRACSHSFDPSVGSVRGAKASCQHCQTRFAVVDAMARAKSRPAFRLYGKLVLTSGGTKQYMRATVQDQEAFDACSRLLRTELAAGSVQIPDLALENGYNTRQAMSYGFARWRDFFNDRQLLALGWLRGAIAEIADVPTRKALMTLFSGTLEFNNLFASYKGEGTGAVRHMFSHHILKPERTPIEANVWGTPKSSGSFSSLLRGRLLRALDYRDAPTEVNGRTGAGRVCSRPMSGRTVNKFPGKGEVRPREIYISCGDSAATSLVSKSIDIVVTDPPFFDNVHYSELADFFYAWHQVGTNTARSTRNRCEVQDTDASSFARKLRDVFCECHRVLKDDGLFVFTYHHSRDEGWSALADAILGSGFIVVNSQPVKAEMSVAAPKSQAKDPIQLDIVVVCRKQHTVDNEATSPALAVAAAQAKLRRLETAGLVLSQNDRRITLYGQMLTTLRSAKNLSHLAAYVAAELRYPAPAQPERARSAQQSLLFAETMGRAT
jgi:putative DNA methylase